MEHHQELVGSWAWSLSWCFVYGLQIAALDTPCQQAAVNARDRVFNDFTDFYYKQVDEHKKLVLSRLKGEMQWKQIWEVLVSKCKGNLSWFSIADLAYLFILRRR